MAVDVEMQSKGEGNSAAAHRLHDLAKYLVTQVRIAEAELVMVRAVSIVVLNTLQAGLSKPPEEAASIVEGYEILLKVFGMDPHSAWLTFKLRWIEPRPTPTRQVMTET